jgi:DNA-binding HxlR family transcriptional regulator
MKSGSYGQFCPVAMAAELLCTRWTILIVRELLSGTTRFNDLRRGNPRVPPALLSQRLKALEVAGVVERNPVPSEPGVFEYRLTKSGLELRPLVESMGRWGHRWICSTISMNNLDAQLLMWDMRRNIAVDPSPRSRKIIEFNYPDAAPKDRKWWLVIEPDSPAQICSVDPGHDVDLYVTVPLGVMTAIWMGHETFAAALADDRLRFVGDTQLAVDLRKWLRLSWVVQQERQVA